MVLRLVGVVVGADRVVEDRWEVGRVVGPDLDDPLRVAVVVHGREGNPVAPAFREGVELDRTDRRLLEAQGAFAAKRLDDVDMVARRAGAAQDAEAHVEVKIAVAGPAVDFLDVEHFHEGDAGRLGNQLVEPFSERRLGEQSCQDRTARQYHRLS
jgi:hypothetical protein